MIAAKLHSVRRRWDYAHYSRYQADLAQDLSFTAACQAYPDRNALHAYMHHFLRHLAPQPLREHRLYFSQNQRGFGEDALHAMWYTLLREFRPRRCLEIGVYRGQVLTLWGLVAQQLGFPCELHGISPFSPAGDTVSVYLANLDYYADVLASNARFGLPELTLLRGFSTDPAALEKIAGQAWDLIYIDGNHDHEVVLADYEACRRALAPQGLLVMDDSSLYTDFTPPSFSFAGHPGPSEVVRDRAMREMRFLGGVGHNNVFQNG